jgi:NACalpha-BTF3-like transcription factor
MYICNRVRIEIGSNSTMTRKYHKVDKEEKKPHQNQPEPEISPSQADELLQYILRSERWSLCHDESYDAEEWAALDALQAAIRRDAERIQQDIYLRQQQPLRGIQQANAAPAAVAKEEGLDHAEEDGLDPAEIATVIDQTGCTRAQAIRALRRHDNLVDAIVSLFP